MNLMEEENIIITSCPHCNDNIVIYKKDIKCAILDTEL